MKTRAAEQLAPKARTRKLTIVAQDPAVTDERSQILTAEVDVPAEALAPGPWGYQTIVSTMAGKHGSVDRGTEVPRSKLVKELESQSSLLSTQSLTKKSQICHTVRITV